MRILLITPPMTQLNAPYGATPQLAGFLRMQGWNVQQADLGLELALRLFSAGFLTQLETHIRKRPGINQHSSAIRHFLRHAATYRATVDAVVRHLQGKDSTLAYRIASRTFLPEGPRFAYLRAFETVSDPDARRRGGNPRSEVFGTLSIQDQARHLAGLYLDDLADAIRDGADRRFALARFGESLALKGELLPLARAVRARGTLVDEELDALAKDCLEHHQPNLVAITVPFPGALYGTLRLAHRFKTLHSDLPIAIGGGFVSTELRRLEDPRLFDFVDYVILDDGEEPLRRLAERIATGRKRPRLLRTFFRHAGRVRWRTDRSARDPRHDEIGTPTYAGLPLRDYLSLFEMLNPMIRLWSDGRWNRLQLAHGCYWKRCAFCDTTLPQISRFSPASPATLVRRINAMIEETGQQGFHFVDEAAPPALLSRLSEQLLRHRIPIVWWGNVRFEKAFTPRLVRRLAKAGCVAVTAGIETPVNRLLRLLNKGFDLAQVVRAASAFSQAGILVHAYLMYGVPTQTIQETVDGLEFVRQLFQYRLVHSAYWHRYTLTAHSAMARRPARYGIRSLLRPSGTFTINDIPFQADDDENTIRMLGEGLRRATYNYMHGIGWENPIPFWFAAKVPAPTMRPDFVETILGRHC